MPIIQQISSLPLVQARVRVIGIDDKDDLSNSHEEGRLQYSKAVSETCRIIIISSPMHAKYYILTLTKGIHLNIGLRGKSSGEDTGRLLTVMGPSPVAAHPETMYKTACGGSQAGSLIS